ncbi:sensor histidine kinase [Pedobacter polaris]|uniref:sensor histidine kinase n=1 Tax=Pedobacter polaris TaxID=2571273 RepID=UPI00145D39DC|nr:HAMP domain-containing sensor histidine kinase [Pedobacter polaris]
MNSPTKTEEHFKKSIDIFSNAFKYSATGIALISPDGKWLEVNDAVCTITGYSKHELMKLTFQDITYPDDLEIDLELVGQMLNKEIDNYNLEKRYITKTSKVVWVLLTVSLVWSDENTPNFFISQILDITESKELTDELRRKNEELEATQGKLVEKVEQLEEFSHIIAHNVRGPAKNIQMLAEMFKKTDSSENLFGNLEIIGMIDMASTSLLESLETLIISTQMRLDRGITYDNCDIKATTEQVISQLQGVIHEKKAIITQNFLVYIVSYPKIYLENILYNLISNALKYSKKNVAPKIILSTRQIGDNVILSVKDNGLGIDLKKFGNKIFKLNETFHKGYDSRGIGLYLLKTQIESLNGTISVKSKVNSGTEFVLIL